MTTIRTIRIRGIEFDSANEAIQHISAGGRGVAITIDGAFMVVERAEADRLAAAGASFAYLGVIEHPDHEDGLVITTPIN